MNYKFTASSYSKYLLEKGSVFKDNFAETENVVN